MAEHLPIDTIVIGDRHRKDYGDLSALAESIRTEGLLQPIGVTLARELVFGERRLRACRDILGWTEIDVRVVDVSSITAGEWHENEERKGFTASERVAILKTIDRLPVGKPSEANRQNLVDKNKAAELAGFGNRETARQAMRVVERGIPELVAKMDAGEVSVSKAAEIAKLAPQRQAERLQPLPSKAKPASDLPVRSVTVEPAWKAESLTVEPAWKAESLTVEPAWKPSTLKIVTEPVGELRIDPNLRGRRAANAVAADRAPDGFRLYRTLTDYLAMQRPPSSPMAVEAMTAEQRATIRRLAEQSREWVVGLLATIEKVDGAQ